MPYRVPASPPPPEPPKPPELPNEVPHLFPFSPCEAESVERREIHFAWWWLAILVLVGGTGCLAALQDPQAGRAPFWVCFGGALAMAGVVVVLAIKALASTVEKLSAFVFLLMIMVVIPAAVACQIWFWTLLTF